ncbi:MAG: hypothetical protein H6563_11430 [Lewinellaceae bacterium]|nr:hypothetical protein [Lewinellaceae bacterium]
MHKLNPSVDVGEGIGIEAIACYSVGMPTAAPNFIVPPSSQWQACPFTENEVNAQKKSVKSKLKKKEYLFCQVKRDRDLE